MLHIFSHNSINKKILLAGSISLLVVAGVIILFAALSTYGATESAARTDLTNIASYQAERVRETLAEPMEVAEGLASVIKGPYLEGQPLDRSETLPMLKQVISDHPLYNGVYTMWEADAYDHADTRYAGKEGYAQAGRMNQYWYREAGNPVRKMYDADYDDVGSDYTLDYYTLPMQSHLNTLTDPYIEQSQGTPVLMASTIAPIMIKEKFVGITGVDVTLADLDQIADETNLYDGKGRLIILSSDGTIAGFTGDVDLVGQPLTALAPVLGVTNDSLNATQKTDGIISLGQYIGVTAPVTVGDPSRQWSVLVVVPSSVLSGQAISLTLFLVFFGIIVSAGGLLLLLVVSRSITRPIQRITTAAQVISSGDLEHRINPDGTDEIADLGRAFDSMADRVGIILSDSRRSGEERKAILQEIHAVARAAMEGRLDVRGDPGQFSDENREVIEAINGTLDAVILPLSEGMRLATAYASGNFSERFDPNIPVSGEFSHFSRSMETIGIELGILVGTVRDDIRALMTEMEESNASVEEIASGSQQIARGTTLLSTQAELSKQNIDQIQHAIEDMITTAGNVSRQTVDVADITERSRQLSESGMAASSHADEGIRSILSSHEETREIIGEMARQVEVIGDIVNIITGLADQIGMLALNAAIEAARAGDAGRGFAIVAGEVKTLALESQKSAEKISSIVSELEKKSAGMTHSIMNSSDHITKGSSSVAEVLHVFSELSGLIHEINSKMENVKSSCSDQNDAVEMVIGSVNKLNTAFDDTTKELGNTAALTEESSVALDCIAQAIQDATVSLDKISREMARFTTG